ncbi:signal peptidase II [Candidatus Woesearchaeota archaeon]|nr:signal peptidase II [Candidatus Woesearchaeota archaeon]
MKKIKYILLFIGLLFLDQITKFIFFEKEINLIGNILRIDFTTNTGVAFGIFSGLNWLWIIISLVAAILVWILFKKYLLSVVLIEVGIIGNLIDRIFFGYVRDFIGIYVWPNFNVADACNTIGVLILAYYLIKED